MTRHWFSPTRSVLLIFLAGWTSIFFLLQNWKKRDIVQQDIVGYYSYLPAVFIYGDAGMHYASGNPFFEKKLWGTNVNSLGFIQKYTMGMAVLYSPFFFAGHLLAQAQDYPPDGYSLPYQMMLAFSGVIYGWLGLLALRKLLLKYFSEWIAAITLVCIAAGTNLNFYVLSDGPMPHAGLFFLATVFCLCTLRFFENPSWKNSILLGGVGALIVLIRPNHLLLWCIPFFYGWLKKGGLRAQWTFVKTHFAKIAAWPLLLFLIYLPQFAYWKYMTGGWIHYSYGDEGFFLAQPQWMNLLFSFRKGWFVYTPMMMLAVLGLFTLPKYAKAFTLSFFVLLLLNIWLLGSWWCWWYGGSFGSRAFIDIYGPLAIGLAGFFSFAFAKIPWSKIVALPVLLFFILLNNFQSLQYAWGVLHYDAMTPQAYKAVFFQFNKPDHFETLLDPPDYDKALKGEMEYGD